MDLDLILDNCLRQIETGESVASCLNRYPDHADALAPMLAAATELQTLRGERLHEAERQRIRALLRATLAAQGNDPTGQWRWSALFESGRIVSLAGLAIAVLFVISTGIAVMASKPGGLPYRLRVLAERSTVLIQRGPDDRAAASLDYTDRRLTDLSRGVSASGQADATALEALLQGMEGATLNADDLTEEKRAAIAQRLRSLADQLRQLAEAATDLPAEVSLREAADRAEELANSLNGDGKTHEQESPEHASQQGEAGDATPVATLTRPEPTSTLGHPSPAPTATVVPTAYQPEPHNSATSAPPNTSGPKTSPANTPKAPDSPTRPPQLATDVTNHGGEPTAAAGEIIRTPDTENKPTQTPVPSVNAATATPAAPTFVPETVAPRNTSTVPPVASTPQVADPTATVRAVSNTPSVKPGLQITPIKRLVTPIPQPSAQSTTAAPTKPTSQPPTDSPNADDPPPTEPDPGPSTPSPGNGPSPAPRRTRTR